MAINGIVCESYPSVAQAALKADWEFMSKPLTKPCSPSRTSRARPPWVGRARA
jgi:hypothetical protein